MLARIANRADPDQTASSEAVWSGSVLFVKACLADNSVRNFRTFTVCITRKRIFLLGFSYLSEVGARGLLNSETIRLEKNCCSPKELDRHFKWKLAV